MSPEFNLEGPYYIQSHFYFESQMPVKHLAMVVKSIFSPLFTTSCKKTKIKTSLDSVSCCTDDLLDLQHVWKGTKKMWPTAHRAAGAVVKPGMPFVTSQRRYSTWSRQ